MLPRQGVKVALIHRNRHRQATKMRRQRNMAQVKDQNKTPEKELNKIEARKLLNAEFKTVFIMMLKELSEDLNSIKKVQSEMKDTLIKIKNNLYGNNSRVDEAEMKSVIWNIRKQEITNQNNKKKKESKKNENSVNSLWDNFKRSNICITGVSEENRNSKKLEIYLKKY